MMTFSLIEPHQPSSLIGKASLTLSEDVGSNPTQVIKAWIYIYLFNVVHNYFYLIQVYLFNLVHNTFYMIKVYFKDYLM